MNRVFIGRSLIGSLEVISSYIREYRGPYKFVIVSLDNGDYRLDFFKEIFSWKEKLWKILFE